MYFPVPHQRFKGSCASTGFGVKRARTLLLLSGGQRLFLKEWGVEWGWRGGRLQPKGLLNFLKFGNNFKLAEMLQE